MDEIKVKEKPAENFVHWEKKCFRTVYKENILVLERGIEGKDMMSSFLSTFISYEEV